MLCRLGSAPFCESPVSFHDIKLTHPSSKQRALMVILTLWYGEVSALCWGELSEAVTASSFAPISCHGFSCFHQAMPASKCTGGYGEDRNAKLHWFSSYVQAARFHDWCCVPCCLTQKSPQVFKDFKLDPHAARCKNNKRTRENPAQVDSSMCGIRGQHHS